MKKNGVEVSKMKRILLTKSGAMKILINELIQDFEMPGQKPVVTFPNHLFTAKW